MNTENVKLSQVKVNVDNPRTITRDKFNKLINSILVFPKMLELRPIVVDGSMVALGGNMRTNALREIAKMDIGTIADRLLSLADFHEKTDGERKVLVDYWCEWLKNPSATVIHACGMSEDERKQFVIKDNVSFGQWNFDMLANDWDDAVLADWGMNVWDTTSSYENEYSSTSITAESNPSHPTCDANEKKVSAPIDGDMGKKGDGDSPLPFPVLMMYDSNNEFDIPVLRADMQPASGLILPFSGWRADMGTIKGIGTCHFYVDDYIINAIFKNPRIVLDIGCNEMVEPGMALTDTTPITCGLYSIYMKRWTARFWQDHGVKVYADLNVPQKLYKYNRLGIPDGYNAFVTRGYDERLECLRMDIQIAREISGKDSPHMMVYGGGERIREMCAQNNLIYVE